MSIATEYLRIKNAKNNLKTSLNEILPNDHKISNETLDRYASFLEFIETGSGSGEGLSDVQILEMVSNMNAVVGSGIVRDNNQITIEISTFQSIAQKVLGNGT